MTATTSPCAFTKSIIFRKSTYLHILTSTDQCQLFVNIQLSRQPNTGMAKRIPTGWITSFFNVLTCSNLHKRGSTSILTSEQRIL